MNLTSVRRIAEPASIVMIGLGLAMLMQPWSLWLYGHSFGVLLAGVAGYTVAGKLPQASQVRNHG
jgi:hypothetical protein